MLMETTMALRKESSRLLGINEIARRWSVSRTSVRRILDAADVRPVFLTRKPRGLRRYWEVDIVEVEQSRPK